MEVQVCGHRLDFFYLRFVHFYGSEDRFLTPQEPSGYLFVIVRVLAAGLIETDL